MNRAMGWCTLPPVWKKSCIKETPWLSNWIVSVLSRFRGGNAQDANNVQPGIMWPWAEYEAAEAHLVWAVGFPGILANSCNSLALLCICCLSAPNPLPMPPYLQVMQAAAAFFYCNWPQRGLRALRAAANLHQEGTCGTSRTSTVWNAETCDFFCWSCCFS